MLVKAIFLVTFVAIKKVPPVDTGILGIDKFIAQILELIASDASPTQYISQYTSCVSTVIREACIKYYLNLPMSPLPGSSLLKFDPSTHSQFIFINLDPIVFTLCRATYSAASRSSFYSRY